MLDVIGEPGKYDYIVASHVIEHVADIVRFVQDCETLLKDGGTLVLAVPDKRYCFDALRPTSTVGQALQAFAEKRTRHYPGVVFDHLSMICTKEGWGVVWREPTLDDLQLQHAPSLARDIFEAALTSSNYLDVHGWQFTPTSFAYLIKTLRGQGYIKSGVQSLQTTVPTDPQMHEFYVALSKTAPICTVSDIDLLKTASAELRDIDISRDDEAIRLAPLNETIDHLRSEIARVEADNAATVARLQAENAAAVARLQADNAAAVTRLQAENAAAVTRLQAENAAILASTSWRVTSPLRYLRTLLG